MYFEMGLTGCRGRREALICAALMPLIIISLSPVEGVVYYCEVGIATEISRLSHG
jgi:hypothetical protein